MANFIDEEMQIADEQDQAPRTMSAETFELPLENIGLSAPLTLDISATIGEAVSLMQSKKIGSVLLTEKSKLKGIITERDILLKVIGVIPDYQNICVSQIMTSDPISLRRGDMVAYVLNNMHVGGYRHVPIINDDGRPIGIISIKDVVSFILDYFPSEISNILGEPYRGKQSREGA